MSRFKDFLIGLTEDSEYIINGCEDFDEFCAKMKKIDPHYMPSLLSDIWDEHMCSQEPNYTNFYDRSPR